MIPKKHSAFLDEMDDEDASRVLSKLPKVGKALKKGLGIKAYNVCQNNGFESGQLVMHTHFHFIPRK